jgi:hypothetical protein
MKEIFSASKTVHMDCIFYYQTAVMLLHLQNLKPHWTEQELCIREDDTVPPLCCLLLCVLPSPHSHSLLPISPQGPLPSLPQ